MFTLGACVSLGCGHLYISCTVFALGNLRVSKPNLPAMVSAGVAVVFAIAAVAHGATYPLPFTRELSLTHPYTSGKDVYILQNLLRRKFPTLNVSREYDEPTELAVHDFNAGEFHCTHHRGESP